MPAYDLTKEHEMANVALLERSRLGGGSSGRDTKLTNFGGIQQTQPVFAQDLANNLWSVAFRY